MISLRSSVIPPRRKLEKLVIETALKVRKVAKITAFVVAKKVEVVVSVAMKADKMTGAFDIKSHVSGADALLIIRDFQNAMRMTF